MMLDAYTLAAGLAPEQIDLMREKAIDLVETVGLHISSVNNRVDPLKTLLTNLQRLPDGHKKLQRLRKEIFKGV